MFVLNLPTFESLLKEFRFHRSFEQLLRKMMEEKLRPILDRLQSVLDEIRRGSLWLDVYVIRRGQLDRLQSTREEISRIRERILVDFYVTRGRQPDRLQCLLGQLERLQSFLEEIFDEALSTNFHVITRWKLQHLESLIDEILLKRWCMDILYANMYRLFESEPVNLQDERCRRFESEPVNLQEEIRRESLSVNLFADTCRLLGSERVNSYQKRCRQRDCLQEMLDEIRQEAMLVDFYMGLIDQPGRLSSKLAELRQIRESFWANLYDEIFGEALSVNLYVKRYRELGRLQSLFEEKSFESLSANLYVEISHGSPCVNFYETRCRQLDRPELSNEKTCGRFESEGVVWFDATESLEDHSMDNLGPPPGGGGLQQQRPLLHYTEVRRGRSSVQESTDNVKGKAFKVKDESVQITVQGFACDLKCKHFGVENRDEAPNVQTCPGVPKSKTFVVKERADEPCVQAFSGVLKDKTFEKKDEANEYRSGEPNTQAYNDDVKDKAFVVQSEATKPNVLRVGCYKQILGLTFAFLLPVANSKFLEVPKNAVILQWGSPESVEMACKSDCQCALKWFVNNNDISKKETLYNGYRLSSSAASYCTVIKTDDPGKCYLNLTNKSEAAQTYICFEPGTTAEASADLVWIGDLICNDSSTEGYVNLRCSVEFRGNWAPTMEWKEHSSHGERVLSVGVNTTTLSNQRVTSMLTMAVQKSYSYYSCAAKFDINGKPNTTTATNVPDYNQNWTSSAFPKSQDQMKTEYFVHVAMVSFVIIAVPLALGIVCLICIKRKRGLFTTVSKCNGKSSFHDDRPTRNTENEEQIRELVYLNSSTLLVQVDVEEEEGQKK